MWTGVERTEQQAGGVAVEFRGDCVDPPLYQVGHQQVACLLYRDADMHSESMADAD